jgi:hypothetical protein
MTIPPYDSSWTKAWTKQFGYEWLRDYLGLMPLRVSCWTHCWMSDAAWTEWKNYSRPRFNYVAWLPGSTPYSVFKSTTVGTRSLFASGKQQHEMSIQAQKSARRLRISKSLTCDALNVALSSASGHVRTPSKPSGFDYADSATSGRTFSQLCARGNGKQALIDSFRSASNRPREEYGYGLYK